jgi:prepilin-type N-terminal cleavage/methylation domain-containing protein
MMKFNNIALTKGFTLLELLVVLAIIATATSFLYPAFTEVSTRKNFQANVKAFETEMSNARLQAFSRGTTVRVNTVKDGDEYIITTFASNVPVRTCGTGGTWSQIASTTVEMNSNFNITGTGIGNICFYRDGTSTGSAFNFAQKNELTNIGRANINIYIATGFVDVEIR